MAVDCINRYKTAENFLKLFNPDMQYDYCSNVKRVYTGAAPALCTLNEAFGKNIAETWLAIQIRDISEYSGCRDKLGNEQIDRLAKVIMASFKFLKVTELMLFFLQFKSGKYGKFYGSVDSLAITESLQDFCCERKNVLNRYEEEEYKRKRDIEEEKHGRDVEQFKSFLKKHDSTISDWLKNRDLFNGKYSTEQIKMELAKRKSRNN